MNSNGSYRQQAEAEKERSGQNSNTREWPSKQAARSGVEDVAVVALMLAPTRSR